MPASRLPTITLSAPAPIAFTTSPLVRMPPSAMAGTPCSRQAAEVSSTAENCGTPTPATTRVVQMLPGPMPIFTASAPAAINASAPSGVATLPATTCTALLMCLIRSTAPITPAEWPCAVSITSTSTPASISTRARAAPSSPTPIAAATRRRPSSSLLASGWAVAFSMSLTVIRPTQVYDSSTTSSFSTRWRCSSRLASSGPTLEVTVMRPSRVISSYTRSEGSVAKRTSRLVRMPTRRPVPRSTTGKPLMRWVAIRARASARVWSGKMVSGLTTMPDSNFLTWRTAAAWTAGSRFLWMTPMPPSWAMAMAMAPSVTVSMAEDTSGTLRFMVRVKRVRVSASVGRTCE